MMAMIMMSDEVDEHDEDGAKVDYNYKFVINLYKALWLGFTKWNLI
jgi:hypothetical protein